MAVAATQLTKIQPASDKDKAILKKVKKELEEGASALAQRQKYIRIADQSEHSWEMVAAYIGSDVATNEDDARRIEKAEKTAEQRVSKPSEQLLLPPPPSVPRDRRPALEHQHRDQLNPPHSCYQDHHMSSLRLCD